MKVKKATMKTTHKKLALQAIRQMPDNASLAEIAEEIAILDGIEKGIAAADAGDLIPHEEFKRQIEQWLTELNGQDRAQAQFKEIVSLIRQDNPPAAEKFSRDLLIRIDSLSRHPRSSAVYKRRRGFEVRQIVYWPYRIIYRVRPRLAVLEILWLWHGARQEPKLGLKRRSEN